MSHYLFIDANYLHEAYRTAMSRFYGETPPLDYRQLTAHFGAAHKTFYYDSIDRNRVGGETEPEREARVKKADAFHTYLNTLPNWHVREGFVSRGRRAARRHQKAVDVQLAVDALEHAVAHNISVASFVFGDLDFEPLLFSLNRFGIDTRVYYHIGEAAPELLEAADHRYPLTLQSFFNMAVEPFRASHQSANFNFSATKPPGEVVATGSWRGRRVELIRDPERRHFMYAESGNDPSEPSVWAFFPSRERERVELAFQMTFGDGITWQPSDGDQA